MRRLFMTMTLACLAFSNTGCFINMWSSDPNTRLREELNVSEDLRQAQKEWERFWMIDQPSHMTPTMVHGGIMPD
jgi:hypothetical protein